MKIIIVYYKSLLLIFDMILDVNRDLGYDWEFDERVLCAGVGH